jgi:hypothetical protein
VGKARSLPKSGAPKKSTLEQAPALLANVKLYTPACKSRERREKDTETRKEGENTNNIFRHILYEVN